MSVKNSIAIQSLIVALVIIFLYSTKYQLPFKESIEWVGATDVYEYLVIASFAPDFPKERISFHFSQRWIPHYLVGFLSYFFGLELGIAYSIANLALLGVILIVALRVLLRQAEDEKFGLLLFFMLALSAFSFRLNIFVPGLLADLVFILGLAFTIGGLQNKSMVTILFGAVIATAGKQFSIIILPGLILYTLIVFLGVYGKIRALTYAGLVGSAVIGFYLFLLYTSKNFSTSNTMTIGVLISIIPWTLSDQFTRGLFLEHLTRIFIPLAPFLLILILLPRHKEPLSKHSSKLAYFKYFEMWALGLLIFGPAAYAFFPGPLVQMGNQSRYMAATLLPMALLTASSFPNLRIKLNWTDIVALGGILMTLSYHHRHTAAQATPITLLVVQMVGLTGFAAWLVLRRKAFT